MLYDTDLYTSGYATFTLRTSSVSHHGIAVNYSIPCADRFCLQGMRAKNLRNGEAGTVKFVRLIILASYVASIIMILSLLILRSGVGMRNQNTCSAAIIVCLVFYYISKVG